MNLIYMLHFYQPDFQFRQALEDVYYNSYKKIFDAIEAAPNAKIVVNITASTIEILNNYHVGTIIEDLKRLYKLGKIEFTATSLAHVLLSEATEEQALRQIKLDIDKKSYYLDIPRENFKILFPPELSVNDQVLDIVKKSGLKGLIVSHSSIKNYKENENEFLKNNLNIFVRSLKLSRICESIDLHNINKFYEILNQEEIEIDSKTPDSEPVYIVAHDAEILNTKNGKIEFFEQLINDPNIKFTTFDSELKKDHFKQLKTKISPGTWEKFPVDGKMLDVHWKNPKNKIHTYQWKLSKLVVKEIENFPDINKRLDLQTHLDYCQYSCQYWWASSYPFWSPGIISHSSWSWLYLSYRTYYELYNINPKHAKSFIFRAEKYYLRISENLAMYDITKWHERNISYYDQFLHPLKLKFQV